MATKIASVNPTCPVCFESFPVVKMLSTCKHVFCRRCLSIHLAKSSPESVVIPCPTCRVESPLPENGVDGLADFTRDGADEEGLEHLGAVGGGDFVDEPAESEETEGNKHCLSCKFKPNASTFRAVNLCEDCGQLPMCWDCTKVHSQNKATRDHVVTSLKHKKTKKEVTCKSHDQLMTSYCSTCARPVCRICVMFEHGDHVIKKTGEIFRELLTDLSEVTKEKKKQLKDLTQMETDLKEMKSTALGERDTLVKAIEDHADKCIEEILDQKKVLKAKVNADYKVIEDMSTCLERIPNIRQKLEDSVRPAERMVSRRDVHRNDLETMANTKESLVVSGKLADQFDRDAYIKDYQLLQQRRPIFEPNTIEFCIGHLTEGAIDDSVGGLHAAGNVKPGQRDIRQCQLIFEKTYMHNVSVESISNLGNNFAVYCDVNGLSPKIDIFDFFGTLKHTIIIDHFISDVRTVRVNIASTPNGNLAVLCEPSFDPSYHPVIYTFHVNSLALETGNMISTTYLDNSEGIYGVFSFDVTARNEYVISKGRSIRVFSQDGAAVLSQTMKDCYGQTTCRGKFVFVIKPVGIIDAYEWRENQLIFITSCEPFEFVFGVSATPDGEVTVLCKRNGFICFGRSVLGRDGFSEWSFRDLEEQAQLWGNISVGGHHIVASLGNTIYLYKEEEE